MDLDLALNYVGVLLTADQSACLLPLLILHRSGGCARVSGVSAILEMYGIEPGLAGIAHISTEIC